ncbi:two-component system response regulator YesN [Paenibacillus sp. DS2015]|uniref:response regulator n=1 Tax=Paenibacillus sp. DS2015 TaxID=3373917 RepID=UPI003D1DC4BC
MYKVIFADDEAVFRKYIRNIIDWEAHGLQLCGEAKNGLEALELVEREHPDIAFIDINMPFMNGMDLVIQIKERYPLTSVLLVTGHSEFEYARQAVKIGVDDYILKPFDEEELLMALAKVKSTREKSRIEQDNTQKERFVWKESFLNLLISNEYIEDNETIKVQINRLLQIDSMHFQVISIEIDGLHEHWPGSNDVRLYKYIIANLLNDLIKIAGQHYTFNGPENRIISLQQYEEGGEKSLNTECLFKLCALIKRHFGFSVTVGVGSSGYGIAYIRQSYKESIIALGNKIALNLTDVLHFEDIQSRSRNIGFYPSEMNENLLIQLRLQDKSGIVENLHAIRDYILIQKLSSDYIHMIMAGLVSLCLTYIYEIGKRVEDILPSEFSPFHEMMNKSSLEAAFEWITELYVTVADHSKGMKHSKSSKILSLARDYIEAHFSDSQLKVENVSKHLYIQPRYLLRIFKQELGMSVSDYIVERRMQRAKELLTSGKNLRLTDISEMIGYSDASHFSKSFKKFTGRSPSEYEVLRSK